MLKLIIYLSLIKYKLIKLKVLKLTPNTFLRMKERLGHMAGASHHDQPMGNECVSST